MPRWVQEGQIGRDGFPAHTDGEGAQRSRPLPTATLEDLLGAFRAVMARARLYSHHHVQREQLSVRQRMSDILDGLQEHSFLEFSTLCRIEEGRLGVVVSFLAVLELVRESLIELVQTRPCGPIHLRRASA